MTAPSEKSRLSDIDGLPVLDEHGRRLGRVWDLRTVAREGAREGASRAVAALAIGRAGLLERLGFKRTGADRVDCAEIESIGARAVTLKGSRRK